MRQATLHLLLIIAFCLQGVVAVGADFSYGDGVQQHCADHDADREDCACCPEGGTMNAGCAAQCSVLQAHAAVFLPKAVSSPVERTPFSQRAIQNPAYVPLIPPKIV
jgi:hypothetical protein